MSFFPSNSSDSIWFHHAVCGRLSTRTALCSHEQPVRDPHRRVQSAHTAQAPVAQEGPGHWHLAAHTQHHLQARGHHQRHHHRVHVRVHTAPRLQDLLLRRSYAQGLRQFYVGQEHHARGRQWHARRVLLPRLPRVVHVAHAQRVYEDLLLHIGGASPLPHLLRACGIFHRHDHALHTRYAQACQGPDRARAANHAAGAVGGQARDESAQCTPPVDIFPHLQDNRRLQ